jgi:hypothetical protein
MNSRAIWRSAWSGLLLPGGIVAPFAVAFVLSLFGPLDQDAGQAIMPIVSVVGLACGGGLWGYAISHAAGVGNPRRAALAGGAAYSVTTLAAAVVLGGLEEALVANGGSPLPIHHLYTVLFVPATFLVAATSSGMVGLAAAGWRASPQLAGRSGAAAAFTFLVLNVAQDVLGRRVGGPDAAVTATMITVTLVCAIGAAMVGSAVLGATLVSIRLRANAPSPNAAVSCVELELQHGD